MLLQLPNSRAINLKVVKLYVVKKCMFLVQIRWADDRGGLSGGISVTSLSQFAFWKDLSRQYLQLLISLATNCCTRRTLCSLRTYALRDLIKALSTWGPFNSVHSTMASPRVLMSGAPRRPSQDSDPPRDLAIQREVRRGEPMDVEILNTSNPRCLTCKTDRRKVSQGCTAW